LIVGVALPPTVCGARRISGSGFGGEDAVQMVVGEALAARRVHIIRDAGHVARHPQEIDVHFDDAEGSATRRHPQQISVYFSGRVGHPPGSTTSMFGARRKRTKR